MNHSMSEEILRIIRDVLAPMVSADGGDLYLVRADEANVALHLAGRFAGCPGNQITTRRIIEPAIRAVAPSAEIEVTWGRLIPAGSTKVDAPSPPATVRL